MIIRHKDIEEILIGIEYGEEELEDIYNIINADDILKEKIYRLIDRRIDEYFFDISEE